MLSWIQILIRPVVDMRSQGIPTDGIERCQLLGKLMEDKLYAHHAVQDSLVISDSEVYSYVDQSIDYFTEQLGSMEKVLEFYNKPVKLGIAVEANIRKRNEYARKNYFYADLPKEEVREFFE